MATLTLPLADIDEAMNIIHRALPNVHERDRWHAEGVLTRLSEAARSSERHDRAWTTAARQETDMSEHAAVMNAIANLTARVDDLAALLQGDLAQVRSELDDVMEVVTSSTPTAPQETPQPLAAPRQRQNGNVWGLFQDMPNKYEAQSIARRIASMAIMGGYDKALLSQNWSQRNDIPRATEEQVAEIVGHWREDFTALVRRAQSLYEPQGWSASIIGMFLAMLFNRSGGDNAKVMRALRDITGPLNDSKTSVSQLEREMTRAMRLFQVTEVEVTEALRLWAGHCEWAHPSVRVEPERALGVAEERSAT